MSEDRLTDARDWEAYWERIKLPVIACPCDLGAIFKRYLPTGQELSLLEVGCAPGRYLAYFYRTYGYRVQGIDYVESAVDITRRNLEMLEVPGRVECADFFQSDTPAPLYDIIFSGGFIEHFEDLEGVVARLCSQAKQIIITIIPNYLGVNGWIMKNLSPQVWSMHRKIELGTLRELHERGGFDTAFCDYFGGLQITELTPRTCISSRRTPIWWIIELPRYAFNKISGFVSRSTGIFPRTRLLSRGAVYIGFRRS